MQTLTTTFTLTELADTVSATLKLPETNPDISTANRVVTGLATLADATGEQLSFLANPKYRTQLTETQALAVLVTEEHAVDCHTTAMVVADPYAAFAQLSQLFEYKAVPAANIAATACIHPSAQIADDVVIKDYVVVGAHVCIGKGTVLENHVSVGDHVHIGDDCVISSHVSIYHHCILHDRVRISANAVIGADGFGFAPVSPSDQHTSFKWRRIAQLGAVVIGNDVRIGANTCIDRGALGDTVIEYGVIIDNLVQIAHNVHIGAFTAIAACTGISGSSRIGKHCILGGNVGVAGHLTIADGVHITGKTLVSGSIRSAGSYSSGTTAMPTDKWRRAAVNFKHLASMSPKNVTREISDLKNVLNRLKSRLTDK